MKPLRARRLRKWNPSPLAEEKISTFLMPKVGGRDLWQKPESDLDEVFFRVVFEKHFMGLSSIGYYSDYRFTWESGMQHFAYLVYELRQDNAFEIRDLNQKEIYPVKHIDDLISWLKTYGKAYISLVNKAMKSLK